MDKNLFLQQERMDQNHIAFFMLLQQVQDSDASHFLTAFETLIEHTTQHFEEEQRWMQQYNFYGYDEHFSEHQQLLAEMNHFFKLSKRMPSMAKEYINAYAREKISRHIMNIDAQLAMFFRTEHITLEESL